MTRLGHSPYRRHCELAGHIEGEFSVSEWRAGDVDLWPIISQDLFLDLFQGAAANTAPPPPPFAVRAASSFAAPALNLWKSRHDLAHWVPRPQRAQAIFLGDGVSLDRVDGSWRDRFGEPIVEAYERQGRACFLMQSGNQTRLPWARPTYAANQIAARAAAAARLAKSPELQLPDHAGVLRLLRDVGATAPSLSRGRIERRARVVAAQAAEFDRVLDRVRPNVAFTVTYYAGLGHAFALACRRRSVLCVDLQHCPHDRFHRAYRWGALPPRGYSTLPALFWTWSQADAENIGRWASKLAHPWHRAIAGGHTQICGLDGPELQRLWRSAIRDDSSYEREILVALQPISGHAETWQTLAHQIASSPSTWRWWIRRHPASTTAQDKDVTPLLSLERPNVIAGEVAQIPLPALLAHMDVLVSLASGAAAEAEILGVPTLFLDEDARDTFPDLIDRGGERVISVQSVAAAIRDLPSGGSASRANAPRIEDTLREIDCIAADYSKLSREPTSDEIHGGKRIRSERQAPCAA